ncbi:MULTISPECIES: DUF2142 domain-containing protein [unclassified Cryobacterium]|uniref:DUF2142 domain-containing protein n=1 Tax=unclassified Cryobacterium TaxID=2649013 RepID=UPI0018CA0D69|nr:DUF2142 domain-containing protein [Cryobacterium sp. CAN_C3]
MSLTLVSLAWAVATPLGGSPDEPAHIIKAASVARGDLVGELTGRSGETMVQVPFGIADAHSWPCFAFNTQVTASCLPDAANGSQIVAAKTTAGLYNPTYYAIVGWPSLLTDDASRAVLMMRAMSALLVSFFLAITLQALVLLRPALITGIGFLAAATPMYFFLAGALNPNALEIATGAALTASLLLVVRRPEGIRLRLWLLAIAGSGVLLAQSRGLSPLWMAVIAVAVLVSSPPKALLSLVKRWDVIATIVLIALGVAAAGLWLLLTGTLESMGVYPGAYQVTPIRAFVEMLVDRSFDSGLVGVFGWLDTPSPAFVYVWWAFLSVALGVSAFIFAKGRVLLGVIVAVAGFFLVPAVIQALSVWTSGYIWQGRYTLVGYVIAVIFATVAVASNPGAGELVARAPRRLILVFAGGTIFAQLFAFLTVMKRYSLGIDADWIDFFCRPQWLPPAGGWPWALVLVVGMGTTAWCLYHSTRSEKLIVESPSPGERRSTGTQNSLSRP